MKNEFYLTLLSNGSMEYFSDNKTSHFSNQLPNTLHLDGEWCVALTEIQYPCSCLTVNEGEYIAIKRINNNQKVRTKTRIEPGVYDSPED